MAETTDIILVSPAPVDAGDLMDRVREDSSGAIAVFVGVARDHSRGHRVRLLEYQAYPPMAEEELARIAATCHERWTLTRVALVHRTGPLRIGEVSVAVVVAAPHRREALDACGFAIEEIKRRVPIWKKEFGDEGDAWVIGDPSSGGGG